LDRAAFAALFYFRRGMVRRRSRGLLAVTANTRARRVLGLRAGLVVLFRLWLLSGQRALARRSVLRLARPWHRLAGLARSAAPRRDLGAIYFFVVLPIVSYILLSGVTSVGLADVPTSLWGGILVTIVVATVGIVASLPLGILLALGRRSKMPAVRLASITFIE